MADPRLNIVLLGSTGFVGSAVLRAALARGASISTLVRSSATKLPEGIRVIQGALPQIPETLFPDAPCVVIHLASKQIDRDGTGYQENVSNAEALMRALPPQVRGIIFGSSMSVYGQGSQIDVSETTPLRPQTPLALVRAASEQVIAEGAAARGIAAWRLRPRFVIGKGDQHTVPGLLKLARRRLCPGNGKQALAMVDVDDYAQLILHLAQALANNDAPQGGALNISYAHAPTLAELLAAAQELLGMAPGWRRLPLWEPLLAALRHLPPTRDLATKLELIGLNHTSQPGRLAEVAPPGWLDRNPLDAFRQALRPLLQTEGNKE